MCYSKNSRVTLTPNVNLPEVSRENTSIDQEEGPSFPSSQKSHRILNFRLSFQNNNYNWSLWNQDSYYSLKRRNHYVNKLYRIYTCLLPRSSYKLKNNPKDLTSYTFLFLFYLLFTNTNINKRSSI